MQKNKVKQIWRDGGAIVNGWLNIPSSWSAEVMAHQGFDSLVVDCQHGFHSIETAMQMFQAISTTDTVPMARVPWNEPMWPQRLLDAGSMGIICPMINSREEAERFVGACRYFPEGYRSKGPTRAKLALGSDYAEQANEEIITMAMIETATAMSRADEICSTPGLDGIYVGPGDLSLTMGGSQGMDFTDPELVAALDSIYDACQRNGIVAGLHCGSAEYAQHMISKGWQFVTISSDSGMMGQQAKESVAIARGLQSDAEASLY